MEPSQTKETTTSSPPLTLPDVDLLTEFARPTMAAVTSFNGNLVGTIAACQGEWFSFLGRRLQENLSMPAKYAACRSLPEVQQVYLDYWKRTVDQYQTEVQVLARTMQPSADTRQAGGAARAETGSMKPH